MTNKSQFTKILNKTDKSQTKSDMSRITSLSHNGTIEKNNDIIKNLRRPRSRKYIQNLIELQELLLRSEKNLKNQFALDGINNINDKSYKSKNPTLNNLPKTSNSPGEPVNNVITDSKLMRHEDISIGEKASALAQTYYHETDKEPLNESDMAAGNELIIETAKQISNNINEELEKEIEAKLEQLGKENPQISRLIALLYPSYNEKYLIECGVICCSGTPIYSREDAAAHAIIAEDAERLKRGYDIMLIEEKNRSFLALEVYTDAYCVIFMDGVVKTII